MKFSALNIDIDGSSLNFLGSRKPVHEVIKERYPHRSCYFIVVGQSVLKNLQIGMGMLSHNKHW